MAGDYDHQDRKHERGMILAPNEEALISDEKSKKFRPADLSTAGIRRVVPEINCLMLPLDQSGSNDELFITGRDQKIYFPREERAIIKYGQQGVHYGIAIPAGEVRLEKGPKVFLPNPRREVIALRDIILGTALAQGEKLLFGAQRDIVTQSVEADREKNALQHTILTEEIRRRAEQARLELAAAKLKLEQENKVLADLKAEFSKFAAQAEVEIAKEKTEAARRITDDQIHTLRREAALDGAIDLDGYIDIAPARRGELRSMSQDEAIAECARVIAETAAT